MAIDTVPAAVPCFESVRLAALAPKGETVLHIYRMLAGLREFSDDDRRDVLELLELEMSDQRA